MYLWVLRLLRHENKPFSLLQTMRIGNTEQCASVCVCAFFCVFLTVLIISANYNKLMNRLTGICKDSEDDCGIICTQPTTVSHLVHPKETAACPQIL